ncbi:unnamed protein product [Moneuplotes crassus]|uniref:Sulfurtransferase n=1 Tax=Euplotes crassus TaxID=5936 RepID=A0AAD1UTI6_EUPCR|nr:unnamed protein product [Moneuplotes crassus]
MTKIATKGGMQKLILNLLKALGSKAIMMYLFISIVTAVCLNPYQNKEPKIIDCTMGGESAHQEFLKKSIPTAVFLDTSRHLFDTGSDGLHPYPTKEQVITAMQNIGVTLDDKIVLYSQSGKHMSTARVYHILKAYGFHDVTVLDGGLHKYIQDGHPTVPGVDYSGPPSVIEDLADPSPYMIDMDEIIEFAHGNRPNMQIIDSRDIESYYGKDPGLLAGYLPGVKQGHVPGSINIPYYHFIDPVDQTFLEPLEIEQILVSYGIDKTKDIVLMCRTGNTSKILYLILEIAGYSDVKLYDGSWYEYGAGNGPVHNPSLG